MFVFKKYETKPCVKFYDEISPISNVNLRIEVGKHPQVILTMYIFYLGQE